MDGKARLDKQHRRRSAQHRKLPQQAGAAAVLIADTRIEPLMTMLTPQDSEDAQALVSEIEIPSALVTKKLGDQMKAALGEDSMLLVELNWEQSMANPDDRVEWEFYTTSNDFAPTILAGN